MPSLTVEQLQFTFPDAWNISKYDDWSFYRNRFCRFLAGAKAVDLLAVCPERILFLIEVKDYRLHRRTKDKVISLADEVTKKVLDTLAAMLPCRINGDDSAETAFCTRALRASSLKVILHLEQPLKHSKLFPRAIDPADIQMKMRQQLKPVDAHPKVVERSNMRGLPWTVETS